MTMARRDPSKQRYLDAAAHKNGGEVPFQENQVDIVHVNKLLERDYPLSMRSYEISFEDQMELALQLGNDMIYVARLWELGRKVSIDDKGRKHYVDGLMKARCSLKDMVEPDLGEFERSIDGILACATRTGLGVIVGVNHPPKLVTVAMGYQDYMIALFDDPEFILEFQERCAEYTRRELDMVLSKPVDVVQVPADICMQSGPMYSRDILDVYEFPHLQHTIQRSKEAGKATILHVDGYIVDLMPSFIDMGVDILNPIEPSGKQDIVNLKRQYGGQVAFQGNLDVGSVLTVLSAEKVREKADSLVQDMAPGGGFILASSHDIGANVPWDNVIAMRDAAVAFRMENKSNISSSRQSC